MLCIRRLSNGFRPARLIPMLIAIQALAFGGIAAAQFSPGMNGGGGSLLGDDGPTFQDRVLEEGGPRYGPIEPQPTIADVQIRGRDSVPEQQIWSLLRTRRGREFDPEVLQADVHRLHQSKLFRDVRVLQQMTPEGLLIAFEVFERPTIHYIKYIGNLAIADRSLNKQSGLKVGDALNHYAVDEACRKLEEFYHSKGYPLANVTVLEGDLAQHRGVVLQVDEGPLRCIRSVSFVGNSDIAKDGRLRTLIQSKQAWLGCFPIMRGKVDQAKIGEDVDRLTEYYRSLGYFRARISRELEYDEEGKWLHLTFVIDEGPRYRIRNVSIVGNEKFSDVSLFEHLELRPGDHFNLAKLNEDLGSLRDYYGGRGHVFANIEADPRFLEEPGELDLVYNVEEGDLFRVAKINVHIAGEHPHTRKNVVLNRISLQPGDIVDIREVRASERRIISSQLFMYDPTRGIEPSIVMDPALIPQDAGTIAEQPAGSNRNGTYRGQSPDRFDGR